MLCVSRNAYFFTTSPFDNECLIDVVQRCLVSGFEGNLMIDYLGRHRHVRKVWEAQRGYVRCDDAKVIAQFAGRMKLMPMPQCISS